jgi:maltooligosyltrehalose trehalohydrolase
MLFQGQEYASTRPFLYFADHQGPLRRAVRDGRAGFLAQFPSIAEPRVRALLPEPGAEATFAASRLDPAERAAHPEALALHRDLLALRRGDPVLRAQGEDGLDGAVLGPEAFCLRYRGGDGQDRLLLVNLGRALELQSLAEPLLATPDRAGWTELLCTEDPRYGGGGAPPFDDAGPVRLPAEAALLLAPAQEARHG